MRDLRAVEARALLAGGHEAAALLARTRAVSAGTLPRPARRTRFAVVLIAAAVMLSLGADDARAGTYRYCYTSIYSGVFCPDRSTAAGARHTFKNIVGNWGTVQHSGCDLNVFVEALHAPTTTTNGSPKYYTNACNTAVISFPNNTELLREYLSYSCYCNGTHFMYGYGDYY